MPIFKVESKSFRWLITELVVVVSGILIAFQVEEWRTEINDRAQERILLENIRDDLELDAVGLRMYRDQVELSGRAAVSLREQLESAEPRQVQELMEAWIGARERFTWRITSPTYFSWRDSARPDLVSSPELREQLWLYHEVSLQWLQEYTNTFNVVREEFVENSYLDFEFPIIFDESLNRLRRDPTVILPASEIPRNPNFMTYLNRLGGNNVTLFGRLEDEVLPSNQLLQEQINEHLATL